VKLRINGPNGDPIGAIDTDAEGFVFKMGTLVVGEGREKSDGRDDRERPASLSISTNVAEARKLAGRRVLVVPMEDA